MQQCTETITVLSRSTDPDTGLDIWTPAVIHGVSWHGRNTAKATGKGLTPTDAYTVRIPLENAGSTVPENGDIIVRAELTQSLTPAEVQAAYTDVFTVTGVTDNTRRPRAPHYKVVGE